MHSFKQKSEKLSKAAPSMKKSTPKSSETSLKLNTTSKEIITPKPDGSKESRQASSKGKPPVPVKKQVDNNSFTIKAVNQSDDDDKKPDYENLVSMEKGFDSEANAFLTAPQPNVSITSTLQNQTIKDPPEEKNSDLASEGDDKGFLTRQTSNNEYLTKLRERNKTKNDNKEKEKLTGKMTIIKDTSDKDDKSPVKTGAGPQKVSIMKNAMKSKDNNKVDYGITGMEENSSPAQMNVPTDIFNNSNECSTRNIKVCARFRPCNKAEEELVKSGAGKICVSFPDDKSVMLKGSNEVYTLDKIYHPKSLQSQIYDEMAKEIIEDVLSGYNGTIFAYGQTGSGKTHTMYGKFKDRDDAEMGIVPRSAKHIFDCIDKSTYDVEYVIEASMLEIYRETLNDLLAVNKTDLKIKEDPQKGIHVSNLTQICIASYTELMELLELGDQTRTVKATRMNEYSSRSHTLFTLDVSQRFANDAEKKGKLNLIDLAGSEKVGKSGAAGETLEEAKKINLSLSALGHVIKSLTTDAEHIPYRDSKLTRILQDSLGGNFKTNLIVTGSPHSSQMEETISTLKFATRAKTIKLNFKMNVKNSPDQMNKVVGTMKEELKDTKESLIKYRFVIGKIRMQLQEQIEQQEQLGISTNDETAKIVENLKILEEGKLDNLNSEEFKIIQAGLENASAINNEEIGGLEGTGGLSVQKYKHKFQGGGSMGMGFNMGMNVELMGFNPPLMNEFLLPMEEQSMNKMMKYLAKTKQTDLLKEKYSLTMKLKGKDAEISSLNTIIEEKDGQIQHLKETLTELKRQGLKMEKELNAIKEKERSFEIKLQQEFSTNQYLKFQIEILEKQINKLTSAVTACDSRISDLLREKNNLIHTKFDDYLKTNLEFHEIKLNEFISNTINFSYDQGITQIEELTRKFTKKLSLYGDNEFALLDKNSSTQHPASERVETEEKNSFAQKVDFKSSFFNDENYQHLVEFPGKIEAMLNNLNTTVSKDLNIYLLKKQLINACLINQQLIRCISSLEWKQIIEYGKSKIKSKYLDLQSLQIKSLEKALVTACEDQEKLKNRIEDLEVEEVEDIDNDILNENNKGLKKTKSNTKILRTCRRDSTRVIDLKFNNYKAINEIEKNLTNESKSDINSKTDLEQMNFQKKTLNLTKIKEENIPSKDKKIEDDLFERTIEEIEKESLPLTYENAVATIKKKNEFIKSLRDNQTLNKEFTGKDSGENKSMKELKMLRNKNITLQNDLQNEKEKAESYFKWSKEMQNKIETQKKFIEEMELASQNNLKEESIACQRAINEIKEINEKELMRRQIENKRLIDVMNNWLSKLTEINNNKENPNLKKLIENFFLEALKNRDQIQSRSFVIESNSVVESNRNSFNETSNNVKTSIPHFGSSEARSTLKLQTNFSPNKNKNYDMRKESIQSPIDLKKYKF